MHGQCAFNLGKDLLENISLDLFYFSETVMFTASEKQNKSCLDFQANLPSFNATLVVHKSTFFRSK
jgi:hypothetical protein